jgi:hypothetical protein
MRELNKDIKIFTDINFNDINYQPSAKFSFIKGKKYIVSYVAEYSFVTKDENGSYIHTNDGDENFISLSEFREQQLNKLLL